MLLEPDRRITDTAVAEDPPPPLDSAKIVSPSLKLTCFVCIFLVSSLFRKILLNNWTCPVFGRNR